LKAKTGLVLIQETQVEIRQGPSLQDLPEDQGVTNTIMWIKKPKLGRVGQQRGRNGLP
jgi:hypothetical protein